MLTKGRCAMKKYLLGILLVGTILSGCARNAELIKALQSSTRNDVFQELSDKTPPPTGYADLEIVAVIKTHRLEPGMILEDKVHGTSKYQLLVNIDGQSLRVKGDMTEENYDLSSEHPSGVRYTFQKLLRLSAGIHKVFIALPQDSVVVKLSLDLASGSRTLMELQPIYVTPQRVGRMSTPMPKPDFLLGVEKLDINLSVDRVELPRTPSSDIPNTGKEVK
jgi:hypothetical protein